MPHLSIYFFISAIYIYLIREVDNVKLDDAMDIIVSSILYYYSLIRRFDITDTLIAGIRFAVTQLWKQYMSDIETEENIDLIGVMSGTESDVFKINDSNLFRNITHVIISYLDKNDLDPSMDVLEIFNYNYLPGMRITHAQISRIIEFYLNQ
jgi:hypothetical protein